MRRSAVRSVLLPLITAFIWGSAFVAQSLSSGHIGPFTFNAARSLVGAVVLLLTLRIRRIFRHGEEHAGKSRKTDVKSLLPGGICCGFFLALASVLQQYGITTTGAGKAGFITALYVVLVPLAGLFFGRKCPSRVWFSVLLAVCGLYFLCIRSGEKLSIGIGELSVFLCAFAFTAQILCVDRFVKKTDPVALSCAQFFLCFVFCSIGAVLTEEIRLPELTACIPYILYVGVFSSGIAYTLQIVAQKEGDPVLVSLLLSLEAFFAVVTGALILHERLSERELLGCALMMAAVLLSQLKRSDG